jgi:spermidine synthase
MEPDQLLAEGETPDSDPVTLTLEEGHYVVRVRHAALMSSGARGSEQWMAAIACRPLAFRDDVRILIGGLGLGFTLRAALDELGDEAEVVVVELLPMLVEWHRGPLGPISDHALDDPRVRLEIGDVVAHFREGYATYDAILLDIDNGPEAFTVRGNESLYGDRGIRSLKRALRPGGVLVVWSAFESPDFVARLERAGFSTEVVPAHALGGLGKGAEHRLIVAREAAGRSRSRR